MVGRVSEGKLQPVGFSQQDAHFLIAPVHRGKVLQEDHQTLPGEEEEQNEYNQSRCYLDNICLFQRLECDDFSFHLTKLNIIGFRSADSLEM